MLERLTVAGAPTPQGPYSSVVRAGDFLFVSGQGPVNAETGEMESEISVQEQTRLVLGHIRTILRGCGADLEDVVKCSVFLADPRDFLAMNEVYGEVFGSTKPARTTIAAGMVAEGMKVEIDCIAYRPALLQPKSGL
jgi:2-iminobutanoate/2-iminopropanoate deaminase